ncbi:NUDIX hydrolase N-terminal domain-containing protein [soil metagenome]
MTPAEQIALWADKLRDLSALGLHFAGNIYEKQRYAEIQKLAMAMFAFATAKPLAQIEPLLTPIFSHTTPFTVGDAAVINDAGQILLIQRADNQQWAMPGGAFEVGETPAEGAVREALEETGVVCQAVALVGVFDSRFCGTTSAHQMYQFVFLCKPTGETMAASHAHEVLQTRWFTEDDLPPNIDPGHITRIPVAFQVWRGESQAFFDR